MSLSTNTITMEHSLEPCNNIVDILRTATNATMSLFMIWRWVNRAKNSHKRIRTKQPPEKRIKIIHLLATRLQPVGLQIEIHEIHQNLRNPMCIINKNPPSATKSTCMKRKLSNSNVSRHENEKLPRNPVLLTKSTHSHAFSREHSTRILRRL